MKPTECERTQRFLDGRLGAAECAAHEAHLAACPECTALVSSWRAFSEEFRAQTAPLLAAPGAAEQQRFASRVRSTSTPSRAPAWRWAFAGLVAASLILGVFGWQRTRVSAELVPLTALEDGTHPPGDELDASPDHPALVAIGEDRVGLAPSSRVQVERHDTQQVRLSLVAGAVSATVRHRELGQSFVVKVGSVAVTVVGTRFRVERLPDGVRVDVIEGHVKVSSTAKTWDVLRGQSLELHGATAHTGTFAETEFPEFKGRATAHSPTMEETGQPDAGPTAAPALDVGQRMPGVSPATVRGWRRDALDGKCAQVLPQLRRASREHPQQADVWAITADCARLAGNDREAATAYQHVVALGGADEADHARMLLASLLLERLNDPGGAAETLTAYLKHKQLPALEAAARVKLGRAYLAQGKTTLARRELNRVVTSLADAPSAPEALDLLKQLRPPDGGPEPVEKAPR